MTAPPPAAGRVSFKPFTEHSHLLFTPTKVDRSLKILSHSMWKLDSDDPTCPTYKVPVSVEALEWLRDNFGPLTVTKEVHTWYTQATSITAIAPIPHLPLFDYQREAVGFLLQRSKAMLSLSPGLGKTLVSSTAAGLLPKVQRILVVAPASLLFMWKGELKKWEKHLPQRPHCLVWRGPPKKYEELVPLEHLESGNQQWVIANPETIMRHLGHYNKQRFDLLILDESILYKNRRAQRTKALTNLAKTIPRVWELTGAPATRMLDDLWSQFHLLKPKAYASYWRFADEYCIVDQTPWAKQIGANKRNAEDIIKQRFRDIYFARSQEEVLDIPDWLFDDIDIPMTTYQEKHYNDLAVNLRTELRNEQDEATVINLHNHLSKVVRLIQAASNPMLLGGVDSSGKQQAVKELLHYYPGPYIFWTSFIDSAKLLHQMLIKEGLRAAFMLGETKPEVRQNLVDMFQAGKLDAIVLGQAVGSFGITLTAARTAFYMERNYDGNYFQSLYRFRRIGTTERPIVVHLRSVRQDGSPTIDALVHSMLDYRVGMIQKLTVGMVLDIL